MAIDLLIHKKEVRIGAIRMDRGPPSVNDLLLVDQRKKELGFV